MKKKFAAASFRLGQINALVKKIGPENVLPILRGKLEVVLKKPDPLLRWTTQSIGLGRIHKFVVAENFPEKTGKIKFLGKTLDVFLGKVEENVEQTTLEVYELVKECSDEVILGELGACAEIYLAQLFRLLQDAALYGCGPFPRDGSLTTVYIRDAKNVLRAVTVIWVQDEQHWLLDAASTENTNPFQVGHRFIARVVISRKRS